MTCLKVFNVLESMSVLWCVVCGRVGGVFHSGGFALRWTMSFRADDVHDMIESR